MQQVGNRESPERCIQEAERVVQCGDQSLRELGTQCGEEFDEAFACVEMDGSYVKCRDLLDKLSACTLEKLGLPFDNWEERYYRQKYAP